MPINYTDRTSPGVFVHGVNAKWLEGNTLEEVVGLILARINSGEGADGEAQGMLHKHLNLEILNFLNENNGELTYKGEKIGISHEHVNLALLDLITVSNDTLFFNGKAVCVTHTHNNMDTLELISDVDGRLSYKGNEILVGGEDSNILASQVIETLDRKFISEQQKSSLSGVTDNIQSKIVQYDKNFKETMAFKGLVSKYSDIATLGDPKDGWTVFVNKDETKGNSKTIYVYKDAKWNLISSNHSSGWIASSVAPIYTDALWIDTSDALKVSIKWFDGSIWKSISGSSSGTALTADDITETDMKKFIDGAGKTIVTKMSEDPVTGSLVYNGKLIVGGEKGTIDDSVISISSSYSSSKLEAMMALKQNKIAYIPEDIVNKGKANGYAALDSDAKISKVNIPSDALFKTHYAESEEEMNLLSDIKNGEYCFVNMSEKLYIKNPLGWDCVSDIHKIKQSSINNKSEYNPTPLSDSSAGYSEGSIWINTSTKKSYICTDSTNNNAVWDLMGGQINMNINQIMPFIIDGTFAGRTDGQIKFPLPFHDKNESFVEISRDGVELIPSKDFTLEYSEDLSQCFFVLSAPSTIDQVFHGEVFQADVDKALEYMTKFEYDSNLDGKVDMSDIADFTINLRQWEPRTSYKTNNIVLKDNKILSAIGDFTSQAAFDKTKWKELYAKPIDLIDFNTSSLLDSENRRYVTDAQLLNINKISFIEAAAENLKTSTTTKDNSLQLQINNIKDVVPSDANLSNKLITKSALTTSIGGIKLKDLFDVPDTYVKNAFLKVSSSASAIEYIENPRFPITKVIDKDNLISADVYSLKLNGFSTDSFVNGEITLSPKLSSSELTDMPAITKHGSLLVSDMVGMKYDLVEIDNLTMSVENYSFDVLNADWILNNETGKYEYIKVHNLDSERLILSFIDLNKKRIDNITYQIIDKNTIKLESSLNAIAKVTINCALGVSNGYWSHMFDASRITLIDDKVEKLDRTYSSTKLMGIINNLAIKNDVFTKSESNLLFSSKMSEHNHVNKITLDKLSENESGKIMYNNKVLLTDVKSRTVEISGVINEINQTIVNAESIQLANNVGAILGSEIVIQNTSEEIMPFSVYDGGILLIRENVAPGGVHKYSLGISNKTIVNASGIGKFNYYMTVL